MNGEESDQSDFYEEPTLAPVGADALPSSSGEASSIHDDPTIEESHNPSEAETIAPLDPSFTGPRDASDFENSVPGFTILRVLGQGGMGAVYLAEQERPKRTVALKVIRSDRVSEATLKRFEYEAQLLASLAHPGIAAVYEVGSFQFSGSDVPYFAMEYIAGAKSLTAYAKEHAINMEGRLELFMKVCEAVKHGHQRGVIHRDLKPANILVDEQAEPRIIDFGVARGSDEQRATQTMQTDAGQIVGTLQYMAPEQCTGEGVDVRSDVYALGAVLYQLLADQVPYDIREMNLAEAISTVTETPVTPLDTVVPSASGDLTVIAGKALEKDQKDRYQSVSELAEDVRRYLADMPILARPVGPVGLLRKWMRRNRELGIALSVAASLLLITSTVLAARIIAAERKATRNLELAETNLAASKESVELVRQMLTFRGPDGESRIREGMVDVELLLDDAAASIAALPPELPGTEAAFRELLGVGYISMRSIEKAKVQLERVYEVHNSAGPSAELAEAMHELARAHYWAGEFDQALPLYTEALAMRRIIYDGDHAQTAYSLTHLAATKLRLGDKLAAEGLYNEALAMRRRLHGSEHPDVAASLNNVGNMQLAQGNLIGAERSLRESLRMISRLMSDDSLEVSNASNNLARVLLRRGNHEEALDLYRRALKIRASRLKASDGRVWASRLGLAASLLAEMNGSEAFDQLSALEVAIESGPADRASALIEIASRLARAERWSDTAMMLDGVLLIDEELRSISSERSERGDETQHTNESDGMLDAAIVTQAVVMRAQCALKQGALTQAETLLLRAMPTISDRKTQDLYNAFVSQLTDQYRMSGRSADAIRSAGLAID